MKKDFCYCNGKGCSLKMRCLRYQDGLKVLNEYGHLWMDDCGDDRVAYVPCEPRF